MIVPNLMVTDMARSIAFYRDVVGLTVTMMVTADRQMLTDGDGSSAVFAMLDFEGGQLMLQTNASLAQELPVFAADQRPVPAGTVYIRGQHPESVAGRVSPDQVVKGPFQQWYGMVEIYLRDPDGHIICLGALAGPPPG